MFLLTTKKVDADLSSLALFDIALVSIIDWGSSILMEISIAWGTVN